MVAPHPPKPRFALRVGVTGHRPNRLPQAGLNDVNSAIVDALDAIRAEASKVYAGYKSYFAEGEPDLSVLTSLAEGADTMAARAALIGNYSLEVVLPFSFEEYGKDFSPDAFETFSVLLQNARARLELNGSRTSEAKSYEAAGLTILDLSDILIAVWDGKPAAGRGGTAELVSEAARRGMPIIRIDAEGLGFTKIQWRGFGERHSNPVHIDDHPLAEIRESLPTVVEALTRPPRSEREQPSYVRYCNERAKERAFRLEFPLLMGLMGVRLPRSTDFWPPQPQRLAETMASGPGGSFVLSEAFGWADAVAIHFAQVFRSAFVCNFLVSAAAIIVLAISHSPFWILVEFGLVLALIFNTTLGQKSHWHLRWIEAREVAERLRVAAPMCEIGTRPFGPFGETPTWTSWYVRAKSREAGLRSGSLDEIGLQTARNSLVELLAGQRKYHETTARRFERLHDNLSSVGKYLFISALVVAFAHLSIEVLVRFEVLGKAAVTDTVEYWFNFVATTMSALGAASYGIRIIGEFDGASRRSARMKAQLDALLSSIGKVPVSLDMLRDVAHHVAEVMLGDVASWRLVVESRELEIPG